MKRNDTNIAMMPTVVVICTILHNICEIHGDTFDERWLLAMSEVDSQSRTCAQNMNGQQDVAERQAEKVRNELAEYFISNRLD